MKKSKAAGKLLLFSAAAAFALLMWPEANIPEVDTVRAAQGTLVRTVMLDGVVGYTDEQVLVSPKNSVVTGVNVRSGDMVKAGQLLIQLDASAEEEALAKLYQLKYDYDSLFAQADAAVSALAVQTQLEWQQTENQLLAAIAASQVRALKDGVVETISVKEGGFAAETQVLITVHGSTKRIAVQAWAQDVEGLAEGATGLAVKGGNSCPVVLAEVQPIQQNPAMRMMIFEPVEEALASYFGNGTQVTVEVLKDAEMYAAIVPLEAFDAEGCLWYAENGVVHKENANVESFSMTHAAVEEIWAGRDVILHPEMTALENGMRVRVTR